jgi:hypothetical protein
MSHIHNWKKKSQASTLLLLHFSSLLPILILYIDAHITLLFSTAFSSLSLPLSLSSPYTRHNNTRLYIDIYISVELKADQQLFFPIGISNDNRIVSFQSSYLMMRLFRRFRKPPPPASPPPPSQSIAVHKGKIIIKSSRLSFFHHICDSSIVTNLLFLRRSAVIVVAVYLTFTRCTCRTILHSKHQFNDIFFFTCLMMITFIWTYIWVMIIINYKKIPICTYLI